MATAMKSRKSVSPATSAERHEPVEVLAGTAGTVQGKFMTARQEMAASLIERDEEIDVILAALLCGENPLLVGPPGTAKSLLLDSLLRWVDGAKKFSVLFTKFTTPEEVFGPISVMGLKADQYRRITTGKLPEADLALADEIFKASSAILNTMLRILNERVFENGDGTFRKVPLKICVAASNEWPGDQEGGKELGALFDRFLVRKKVKPIASEEGRKRLLWKRDHNPVFSETITTAEIDQAHAEAMALTWTPEATDAFEEILRELAKEGVLPGDRRQFKSVAACQAFAYLSGGVQVETQHLEILAHTLWDDPAEQPEKVAKIVGKIANPVGLKVSEHLAEIATVVREVNLNDLASAEAAKQKLTEIGEKLKAIPGGNGRVTKALEYVRDQYRKVAAGSLEAIEKAARRI